LEKFNLYTNFISIVFVVVEFTKELKFIKKIPIKYWSFWISFSTNNCKKYDQFFQLKRFVSPFFNFNFY